jgi:hypothetical protein
LQVLLKGFGPCFGNHLANDGSKANSQNKTDNRSQNRRDSNLHYYRIHNPHLSLAVTIDLKKHRSIRMDCGISQQESYKEMAASYEILFAGVKN